MVGDIYVGIYMYVLVSIGIGMWENPVQWANITRDRLSIRFPNGNSFYMNEFPGENRTERQTYCKIFPIIETNRKIKK